MIEGVYEGMAACDDILEETPMSLNFSIIGDIFEGADSCELLIIVEDALKVCVCKFKFCKYLQIWQSAGPMSET